MSDGQLKLFRPAPTKTKYVYELPECGICNKNKADYRAPTKFGIWTDFCKECAKTNTDGRFHLGTKLALVESRTYKAIERTDPSYVVAGTKFRMVACEVCETQQRVEDYFEGVITCKSCLSHLRVGKLL